MTTTNKSTSKVSLSALLAGLPKIVGSNEYDYRSFSAEALEALKTKSPNLHAFALDQRGESQQAQAAVSAQVSDLTLKAIGLTRQVFNGLPKDTRDTLVASAPKVEAKEKAPIDLSAVAKANGMDLISFNKLPQVVRDNLVKASRVRGFDGRPTVRLGKDKATGESTGTVQITGILPMNHTLGLSPNNACRLAAAMVEVFETTAANFANLTVKEGQDRDAVKARVDRINAALQSIRADLV